MWTSIVIIANNKGNSIIKSPTGLSTSEEPVSYVIRHEEILKAELNKAILILFILILIILGCFQFSISISISN